MPVSEGAAKALPQPPVKHGRRAEKAMNAIMDAAERLFAYNGIEGVSLRQILIEAKQHNKYAISLYFGTKEDLVFAIISRRIAEMNIRRRVLIAEAQANGTAETPRAVLEIIFRPLAEVSDNTGQYTYARFLHQAMLYHSFSARWPLVRYESEQTAANRDLRRLAKGLSEDMFDSLLAVIAGIFLSSITARGLRVMEGRPVVPFDEFFPLVLNMATAAFQAGLPAAQ